MPCLPPNFLAMVNIYTNIYQLWISMVFWLVRMVPWLALWNTHIFTDCHQSVDQKLEQNSALFLQDSAELSVSQKENSCHRNFTGISWGHGKQWIYIYIYIWISIRMDWKNPPGHLWSIWMFVKNKDQYGSRQKQWCFYTPKYPSFPASESQISSIGSACHNPLSAQEQSTCRALLGSGDWPLPRPSNFGRSLVKI